MRTAVYETIWQEEMCDRLAADPLENGYENLLERANFGEINNEKTDLQGQWCLIYTQSLEQLYPQMAPQQTQGESFGTELQVVYWEMCHQTAI